MCARYQNTLLYEDTGIRRFGLGANASVNRIVSERDWSIEALWGASLMVALARRSCPLTSSLFNFSISEHLSHTSGILESRFKLQNRASNRPVQAELQSRANPVFKGSRTIPC